MKNELIPIPTYPKLRGHKSATTDWAHHVGWSSGLITIVVMTLFYIPSIICKPTSRLYINYYFSRGRKSGY